MTKRPLAFLIGLSIPISTVSTNILCPLAFLLLLREGRNHFNTLRHHPLIKIAVTLFGVMLLGLLYTSASWSEAWMTLDKYREILYIPLFILLFRDFRTQQAGLYGFLTAMGITLLLSYLIALTEWPLGKGPPDNAYVFKNHITQGLFMSLALYFLAVQCWQSIAWRKLYIVIILLACYNIIFMTQGRTGYIVLASLILLLMYQVYHLRGLLLGSMIVTLFALLAYTHSQVVKTRIDTVSGGVEAYQAGNTGGSIPGRLGFLQNSLLLVLQHPFLGTGTGSFSYEYEKLAQQTDNPSTTNPHNEYLMMAVQWGIVGVGLFIYLLYQLWITSFHLDRTWMAQGVVIAMSVGCLFNSFLLDSTEGHLFAFLVGVFWGSLRKSQSKFSWWPWIILGTTAVLSSFTSHHPHASLVFDRNFTKELIEKVQQPSQETFKNPLKTTLQTEQSLTLTLPLSERITLSSQIQVAPEHVGQSGYLMILANYQASSEAPVLWLQRHAQDWQPMDMNHVRTEQYYPHLPEHLEVLIYQGRFVAPGKVTVFAGYILKDKTIVLNPVQVFMIKP